MMSPSAAAVAATALLFHTCRSDDCRQRCWYCYCRCNSGYAAAAHASDRTRQSQRQRGWCRHGGRQLGLHATGGGHDSSGLCTPRLQQAGPREPFKLLGAMLDALGNARESELALQLRSSTKSSSSELLCDDSSYSFFRARLAGTAHQLRRKLCTAGCFRCLRLPRVQLKS